MTTTTAFLPMDFSKKKIPVEVLIKWSLNLGFLGLNHSLGIQRAQNSGNGAYCYIKLFLDLEQLFLGARIVGVNILARLFPKLFPYDIFTEHELFPTQKCEDHFCSFLSIGLRAIMSCFG